MADKSKERLRAIGKEAFDNELAGGQAPWHEGMALWFSSSREGIAHARERKRRQLASSKLDGAASGQYVVFATSRALCTLTYEAQWTGGAAAFNATEASHFDSFEGPLSPKLSAYVEDAALVRWAREALFDAEPESGNPAPAQIDLAAPVEFGWNEQTDLKKDPTICLRHERGRVLLTGNLTRRSNMERAFVTDVAIGRRRSRWLRAMLRMLRGMMSKRRSLASLICWLRLGGLCVLNNMRTHFGCTRPRSR